MATPTFVNVGTRSNGAPQTSRTPALPASLVNGNLLICTALTKIDQDHSISGSGWQAVHAQQSAGFFRVSRWWRIVDGTETAPTVSWATGTSCFAQISQYSGTDPTNPFGNISHNLGTTSTHSSTGFNTTADNSLVIYEDVCGANTAVATPSGWTENYDNGSGTGATRNAGGSKAVATAGSASGNISVSGGLAQWCQSQIELLEASGATTHDTSGSLIGQAGSIAGSAAHVAIHGTTGALTGQTGAVAGAAARSAAPVTHASSGSLTGQIGSVSGSSTRFRAHPASGTLAGQAGAVAGSAARIRAFGSSGVLTGQGSALSASAVRFRAFGSTGVITGQLGSVTGAADRATSVASHDTSGSLTGQGSAVVGVAVRFRVMASSGVLVGPESSLSGASIVAGRGIYVGAQPSILVGKRPVYVGAKSF